MINVEQTIISQYANSPTLTQIIRNMDEYIDPRADLNNFYYIIWNVDTAQGFGLDIWGRIVGVGRDLQVPPDDLYFGFSEASPGSYPFGEQPFYVSGAATQTYSLSDDAYRVLILTKALANISSTNAPALNQLLQNLFVGRGRCYVNDQGNMQFRYTFEFLLTPAEFAIMTESGVLPRPAGVQATLINVELPVFGFASDSAPFGQGTFIQEGAQNAIN